MKTHLSRSFLALGLALMALPACSASSASGGDDTTQDESSADALTTTQRNTLILHVRAAFEGVASQQGDGTGLVGSKKIDPTKLKGEARTNYKGYEHVAKQGMINSGWPRAEVGTIDGMVVYFVSGDVSDTGTEIGFCDARGKLLAMAYTGQGMDPNDKGVDWQTDAPPAP